MDDRIDRTDRTDLYNRYRTAELLFSQRRYAQAALLLLSLIHI